MTEQVEEFLSALDLGIADFIGEKQIYNQDYIQFFHWKKKYFSIEVIKNGYVEIDEDSAKEVTSKEAYHYNV